MHKCIKQLRSILKERTNRSVCRFVNLLQTFEERFFSKFK